MKDLYVLTADADMEAVFRAILARPDSLATRPISFEIKPYWKHDAGVFREGPELLRAVPKGEFHYFLIAFDHDGSGCHTRPEDCAKTVQQRLHQVFLRRDKRKPRPRDYEQIVSRADLQAWNSSPSFHIMKTTLQDWFPRS